MSNDMRAESREVEPIVRACERYWKRTGVPRDAVTEMRLELEGHLDEAVTDGKTLGSVIGRDVEAFAEEWAREFRAPMRIMDRRSRVLPALAGLAAGLFNGFLAFFIAMPFAASSRTCCPVRVSALQPGVDEYLFFWVTVAASLLALAGAISMIAGRARIAAFVWGTAVVPTFLSAGSWFWAILVLLAALGARRHFTQAERYSAEPSL